MTCFGYLQLDRPMEIIQQKAVLHHARGNGEGPGVLLLLGHNI